PTRELLARGPTVPMQEEETNLFLPINRCVSNHGGNKSVTHQRRTQQRPRRQGHKRTIPSTLWCLLPHIAEDVAFQPSPPVPSGKTGPRLRHQMGSGQCF